MIHPHHEARGRRHVRALARRHHRQRGASLVESLILIAVVALALVAAAVGLGRAYQDLVAREAVAIQRFDWDGWGAPEPPPPPPPPAPPPPPTKDTPFWQSALSFAIDLTPIGDIKTLMDPNASGADKALAVLGLGTTFLPGVGTAVKVASAGAKAAKAAKAAHRAENAVDDARDAARAADEAEDAEDGAAAAARRRNEPRRPPPRRMKQHDDCFKRNPAHDVSEFEDQLVSQAEGLNELTVEQYLKNRDLFKSQGRQSDPTQQAERDRVRRELEDDLYEHLLADTDNPSPEQQRSARATAQRRIAATMRSLAALHNADQVGGGGLGAEGVGDRRVNSSLGSQWTGPSQTVPGLSRTEALEAAARAVPEGERGSTLLNVDFGEC